MKFDQEHHPDVMNGGLWMNNGFSSDHDEKMGDWEVDLTNMQPVYRVNYDQEMRLAA